MGKLSPRLVEDDHYSRVFHVTLSLQNDYKISKENQEL